MGVLRSLDSTRGYTLNCDEPRIGALRFRKRGVDSPHLDATSRYRVDIPYVADCAGVPFKRIALSADVVIAWSHLA